MCTVTTVRNNILRIKEERGLSQMRIGELSGLSTNAIGHILRGSYAPNIITLDKIANGLQVKISTFFEERETHEKVAENIHS